ncbi:MAG: CCA tRNA nucleotidyltransferase, partial [Mycobacteriaceae bacterium]
MSETPAAERRTRLLAAAAVTLRQLSGLLTPLGKKFADSGFELYLVGGSVRDAILGRLGNDLDFTTNARPEIVQNLLADWADAVWDTGIAFGTVSATKDGQQIEITTFRADAYDRVSRNPSVTYGESLLEDLIRRDFTINAMAVRITGDGSQDFVDPLGGLDALLAGQLDTPAAPEDSFN